MNIWSNLWLPAILGCFLIADWTVAIIRSRTIQPITNSQGLIAAGGSLAEYRMSVFLYLPPNQVLEAVKNSRFAQQLQAASPLVKYLFVIKMIGAVGGRSDFVKYMPDALVPYVPPYELAFGYKFYTQDLNRKPWISEQAAVVFDDLIQKNVDFSSLTPFLLSGFTCAVASYLNAERFRQLAKALKQKNVPLKEDQLICLERSLMFHGLASQFEDFPPELVLSSGPAASPNCRKRFANIGKDDSAILKKTLAQRKRLLKSALLCWQIRNQQISQEQADSLGLLACELGADYIKTSGKTFLKQLNQCNSFTKDQIPAIQALLISGRTSFGPPSKWTASQLNGLKGLISLFDQKIMSEIPMAIITPWLKTFIKDTQPSRETLARLMELLQQPNKQQGTSGCPADKTITENVAKDPLMPLDYTPAELRACVTSSVLRKYLHLMSRHVFKMEQAKAVKLKLDEMYPGGYPESVLHKLGGFLHEMTPEDVKKWKITSADILYSLLANQPPDTLASAIIKKYTDSEQFLDSFSVFAIGTRYICLLDAKQLSYIDEESIQLSISLDTSGCSQTTKDVLYPKAKHAFFHQKSNHADYYSLIRSFLGGAPSEDLKAHLSHKVGMDIDTFMNLKQSSLMKLTPNEVKSLLGVNLQDLNKKRDKTPVKEWIELQKPDYLDKIEVSNIPESIPSSFPDRHLLTTPSPPIIPSPLCSAAASPFVSSGPASYLLHAFLLTLLLHFFPR